MAVAHDAWSESHTGTTGASNVDFFEWTHTPAGTVRGVLVFTHNLDSATGITSAILYGGVPLTAVPGAAAADIAGELGRCVAYFLGDAAAIPQGAQTVRIERTNNANVMYGQCMTVQAAEGKDTQVHEAGVVLLEGDGTVAVQSVTDGSPGSNSQRYAAGTFGHQTPPTAGTGSTALGLIDIGAQCAVGVRETTPGQGARNVGMSSGTSDDRAAVHLAVKEIDPPPTGPHRRVHDARWQAAVMRAVR